jgi:hypothetical protein
VQRFFSFGGGGESICCHTNCCGGGTFVPAACNALFRFAAAANRFVAASIFAAAAGGTFVPHSAAAANRFVAASIFAAAAHSFRPFVWRTVTFVPTLRLAASANQFVAASFFSGDGTFVLAACNTSFHSAATVNRFVAAPIVAAVSFCGGGKSICC